MGTDPKDRPNTDNDPNNLIGDPPSPNKGKDEGLSDNSGDTGLTSPDTGQGGGQDDSELQQLLRERGFKNPDDLAKSYRELETKKTELEKAKRLNSLSRPPVFTQPDAEVHVDDFNFDGDLYGTITDNDRGRQFLKTYRDNIIKSTIKAIDKRDQNRKANQLVYEVNRLMAEDPERFERLRPIMVRIARENPGIQDSAEGLRWLYSEATKLEGETRKSQAWESLKEIGLDREDIERFKAIASKSKPAKISGAGGGGSTIEKSPDQMTEEEKGKKIIDDILKADTMND